MQIPQQSILLGRKDREINIYQFLKDFLKLEVVAEKNIHNCLTYLTYTKQQDEVQSDNLKSKFKR